MMKIAIPFSHNILLYSHFITFLLLVASTTPIKETQRGLNRGWYLLHPPPLVVMQGRFGHFDCTFFFREIILYSGSVLLLLDGHYSEIRG